MVSADDTGRQIVVWSNKGHLNIFGLSQFGTLMEGAQRLSGRVLDSRPRGCGFESHRCHYVVSLSKTHLSLLSTGSTQEDPSRYN